jgi:hypothetical protein
VTDNIHPGAKKRYEEPRLIVYGDIRIITQSVDMVAGALDGGTNMMGGLQKTN